MSLFRERKTSDKTAMVASAPFGPGFTVEQAGKATHMEVWATAFNHQGGDFCEFRLYDAQGKQFATQRIEGY